MARRLVYYITCTLDGFIARKDGSHEGFLFQGEQFGDLIKRFPECFLRTYVKRWAFAILPSASIPF
jgi:hypothetical protein